MKPLKRSFTPSKDLAEEKIRTETNFDPARDLRSDKWGELNVNDLWNQRILLNNRMGAMATMNKGEVVLQMQRSLAFLDAIIQEKTLKDQNLADQVVVRY